jgi:hypothetical protein
MIMGHCKDCKYWSEYNGIAIPQRGERQCLRAASELNSPEFDSPFFAVDNEDYMAELLTLPTFGCIEFEAGDNAAYLAERMSIRANHYAAENLKMRGEI